MNRINGINERMKNLKIGMRSALFFFEDWDKEFFENSKKEEKDRTDHKEIIHWKTEFIGHYIAYLTILLRQKVSCVDCRFFEVTSPYIAFESDLDYECKQDREDFLDFEIDDLRKCKSFIQKEVIKKRCTKCDIILSVYKSVLKCPECETFSLIKIKKEKKKK